MRVIICGADLVGSSIAAYLSKEDNDVTVIDPKSDLLSQIHYIMDVNTVTGHASDPDILNAAGANDCDLIIAVTENDEINMIACQIGHSLFGIPKKIARIRRQAYLDPSWSNLFSRAHMPIDVIISPETLVAQSILQKLAIPGTTTALRLAEGKAHLIGVVCLDDCPVLHTQLGQLDKLFPELSFSIISIARGTKNIIPDENDMLEVGDEAYIIVDSKHLRRVMAAFGHLEKEARRIIISGGGNIGLSLIKELQDNVSGLQLKVIEHNDGRAQFLSEELENIIILNGDTLERSVMDEASVATAETYIALMNDDESNILGSLLAKQYGCQRVITLVNNHAYYPLVGPLGIDVMVSPKSIIVASIMQHVRRGRIKGIHNIRDGEFELMEIEISDSSSIANKNIQDLEFPAGVVIGAIIRDGKVIIPKNNCSIIPKDHIIILASAEKARLVEKMLCVHVDLF
ncbi:MAG: Trk system potassium transporter TrkA [Zetaproteobacteria bacterium]|nr:MAG: Trk system potassium transporter TrkA [Zetaproteobacteria bacterium]